jgi:exodeoxyribonuclease VII large subunit
MRATVADSRWEVGQFQNALDRLSPAHMINTYRQRLDEVSSRLEKAVQTRLDRTGLQLENLRRSLQSLNPIAVLNRGYAIVTREIDGNVVKNASHIGIDEDIHIQVSQGSLDARITKTNPGGS